MDLDGRGWTRLVSQQRVSYVKTSKGIHIYLLIKSEKTPPNAVLFYQGKRIGDFLSKGKQVVGVGSTHKTGITYELVKRGKWFWKLESMEELGGKLGKYEIELR